MYCHSYGAPGFAASP
ncbi:hypothetical protein ACSFA3_23885 [Variovorax sp. RHLX14]